MTTEEKTNNSKSSFPSFYTCLGLLLGGILLAVIGVLIMIGTIQLPSVIAVVAMCLGSFGTVAGAVIMVCRPDDEREEQQQQEKNKINPTNTNTRKKLEIREKKLKDLEGNSERLMIHSEEFLDLAKQLQEKSQEKANGNEGGFLARLTARLTARFTKKPSKTETNVTQQQKLPDGQLAKTAEPAKPAEQLATQAKPAPAEPAPAEPAPASKNSLIVKLGRMLRGST